MNPFEMVVAIVFIVTLGAVLRAKYRYRGKSGISEEMRNLPENMRNLHKEMSVLHERIQTLERILTDNNHALTLEQEIESLRDKPTR